MTILTKKYFTRLHNLMMDNPEYRSAYIYVTTEAALYKVVSPGYLLESANSFRRYRKWQKETRGCRQIDPLHDAYYRGWVNGLLDLACKRESEKQALKILNEMQEAAYDGLRGIPEGTDDYEYHKQDVDALGIAIEALQKQVAS